MTLRQRAMKRKKKPKTISGTDIISGLPDDLLLKILLYLPTKAAISTCVLSKRWEFLWIWLPKLKYGSVFDLESECKRLQSFTERTLPLHRAPVIRSFHLNLGSECCYKTEDIRDWVSFALSRHLRKLKITTCFYFFKPNILPSSLYNCKSLVNLELNGHIRLDIPPMVCFPSLKLLDLSFNKFLNGESLQRLISICPVLEELFVDYNSCDNSALRGIGLVKIDVPSLLILHFSVPRFFLLDGLVIDTPSLDSLDLEYYASPGHACLFKSNMPDLYDAHIDFGCCDVISSPIRFITSVYSLSICLRDLVYGGGFVFNELEHLKLCVCSDESSSNHFVKLLKASPNLRVLDIIEMDDHEKTGALTSVGVGEHIMSSLQAYDWSRYLRRRPKKKDLAVYILGKRWSIAERKLMHA